MMRRTVEQLGIDDTYLPPQADVAKRVYGTRNIGAALGEFVGNHEVGAQRNKRWRDARWSNLAPTMLRNATISALRASIVYSGLFAAVHGSGLSG